MAVQVNPRLSGVPSKFLVLLLCCCLPKSKCSGNDLGNITLTSSFDKLPGHLFMLNSQMLSLCEGNSGMAWGGLWSYKEAIASQLDLYGNSKAMFFTGYSIDPVEKRGTIKRGMSFNIFFNMSIYKPNTPTVLIFIVKPQRLDSIASYQSFMYTPPVPLDISCSVPSNTASRNIAGGYIYAQINTHGSISPIIWVHICIEPLSNNSSMEKNYSVWVDYDYIEDRMLVYADSSESKPAAAVANKKLNMPWMFKESASFAFFSSMGQIIQLSTWTSMALTSRPSFCSIHNHPSRGIRYAIGFSATFVGPVVVVIILAIIIYLRSKYRRWKKKLDNIVQTMRNLPGVPTQIEYAEIRKATEDFHDKMKLGRGGFGTVYKCTLHTATLRMGQSMEVAVKKFMRGVEHERFNDFMAEVSIINRLRHKNIVPLIGWSYHKGEPILIYEYMMNGSLDQHLFLKSGTSMRSQQHQRQEQTSIISTWQTRYNIAKDIAIGLHYVHHEHEPMVLHRDIKASNIMVDSTFRARLGDFGISSTVAVDRSSVSGIAGTMGYMAPEHPITHRSTRQTDIFAFGVLILELVTGKKNGDVPPNNDHITDWVWSLHQEGRLLEVVDASVLAIDDEEDDQLQDGGGLLEVERLLLLGLACTNPSPFNRPSMAEAVQIITRLAPPPEVPLERPTFMWPPQDWRTRKSIYSTAFSSYDESSASMVEMDQVSISQDHSTSIATGRHGYSRLATN